MENIFDKMSNEHLLGRLFDSYEGDTEGQPTFWEYKLEVLKRMDKGLGLMQNRPVKVTARCHWCEKPFEKSKGVGAAMNFCSSACLTIFRKTYSY